MCCLEAALPCLSQLVPWPQALGPAICSGISSLALSPALVALARSGAAFQHTASSAAGRIYDVSDGDAIFLFPPQK